MKTSFLLLFAFALASCAYDDYEATSATGNHVKERHVAVGGTSSIKRSDGSSLVEDLQTSFRDGTNMALGVSGGMASASVSKAKTASDNATAVKQAGIASKITLGQQKLANDAAANAAKAANDQALIQAGHFKTP